MDEKAREEAINLKIKLLQEKSKSIEMRHRLVEEDKRQAESYGYAMNSKHQEAQRPSRNYNSRAHMDEPADHGFETAPSHDERDIDDRRNRKGSRTIEGNERGDGRHRGAPNDGGYRGSRQGGGSRGDPDQRQYRDRGDHEDYDSKRFYGRQPAPSNRNANRHRDDQQQRQPRDSRQNEPNYQQDRRALEREEQRRNNIEIMEAQMSGKLQKGDKDWQDPRGYLQDSSREGEGEFERRPPPRNVRYNPSDHRHRQQREHGGANSRMDRMMDMTGRQRQDYDRWRQQQEEADKERLARSQASDGGWKRDWDVQKNLDDEEEAGEERRDRRDHPRGGGGRDRGGYVRRQEQYQGKAKEEFQSEPRSTHGHHEQAERRDDWGQRSEANKNRHHNSSRGGARDSQQRGADVERDVEENWGEGGSRKGRRGSREGNEPRRNSARNASDEEEWGESTQKDWGKKRVEEAKMERFDQTKSNYGNYSPPEGVSDRHPRDRAQDNRGDHPRPGRSDPRTENRDFPVNRRSGDQPNHFRGANEWGDNGNERDVERSWVKNRPDARPSAFESERKNQRPHQPRGRGRGAGRAPPRDRDRRNDRSGDRHRRGNEERRNRSGDRGRNRKFSEPRERSADENSKRKPVPDAPQPKPAAKWGDSDEEDWGAEADSIPAPPQSGGSAEQSVPDVTEQRTADYETGNRTEEPVVNKTAPVSPEEKRMAGHCSETEVLEKQRTSKNPGNLKVQIEAKDGQSGARTDSQVPKRSSLTSPLKTPDNFVPVGDWALEVEMSSPNYEPKPLSPLDAVQEGDDSSETTSDPKDSPPPLVDSIETKTSPDMTPLLSSIPDQDHGEEEEKVDAVDASPNKSDDDDDDSFHTGESNQEEEGIEYQRLVEEQDHEDDDHRDGEAVENRTNDSINIHPDDVVKALANDVVDQSEDLAKTSIHPSYDCDETPNNNQVLQENVIDKNQNDDVERTPIDDAKNTRIDDVEKTPIDDAEKTPIDDAEKSPIDDAEKTPIDDAENSGIDDVENTPIDDAENSRIDNVEKTLIDDVEETPIDDIEKTPIDDVEKTPIDDVEETPIDDVVKPSIDDVEKTPIDDVVETPIDDVEETPIDDVEKTPIDDVEKTPSDDVEKTPSDDVEETPIDDVEKTQIKDVEKTQIDDVEETPIDDVKETQTNDLEKTQINSVENGQIDDVEKTQPDDLGKAEVELTAGDVASTQHESNDKEQAVETEIDSSIEPAAGKISHQGDGELNSDVNESLQEAEATTADNIGRATSNGSQ